MTKNTNFLPRLVVCCLPIFSGAVFWGTCYLPPLAHAEEFASVVDETRDESAVDDNIVVPRVDFQPDFYLAQSAQDPSITTVDEMDARRGAGNVGNGGRWWDSIRDPSIRTVDEQTYGDTKPKDKQWYERINIRGYTQFRINSVLWNDDSQAPPYHPADKSIGPFNEFFIRRCRIIFSGDLSDRLYF